MEWIFLAALFNGTFLALAIPFIRTRNRSGKFYLAGIFAVLVLSLLDSYLALFKGRGFFGIGLLGEFYLAPLIYLFSLSLISPVLPRRPGQLVLFIPAVTATLMLIAVNAGAFDFSLGQFLDQRFWGTALWVGAKVLCIFGFLVPAYLKLSHHLATVPTGARKYAVPVKDILLVFGVMLTGVYVNYTLFYFGLPGIPDSDNYSLLLVSFMLFVLGLMVVARRETLDGFYAPSPSRSTRANSRIKALIEKERVYLDPDLTLKSLAERTGLGENNLSQAFYHAYGKKFFDVINEKRVQEFKALAQSAVGKPNILRLAFEAGFNSKATFYRAFQSLEGVSPSAFIKTKTSHKRL